MEKRDTANASAENGKYRNRREWVKNIIIVFLLIMLILTFFSNTIMNYSLPEVSVARMSRDKVSKSYTLDLAAEANKNYSVTADENREIKRVAVRRGQEVKEGQTLLFLAEVKDSAEARELQEMIDAEKTAYEKALIKASENYFELNQAVAKARDALNQAINDRNNAPSVPAADPEAEKNEAARKAVLEADLENISAGSYEKLSSDTANRIATELKAYESAKSEASKSEAEYNGYLNIIKNAGAENGVKPLERSIAEQKAVLEQKKAALDSADSEMKPVLMQEIASLELKIKYAEEDLKEVNDTIALLEKSKTDYTAKQTALETAEKALARKCAEVSAYLTSEVGLGSSSGGFSGGSSLISPEPVDYDAAVREAQYALDAAVNTLAKQMETDRVADAQTQLDLQAQKKKIDTLEQDMEKLLSKQSAMEVKSPVDGVVEEIMVASGQSFMENDELMTLNISDDGFTAQATVTAEQAKVLTKGKQAKIADRTENVTVTVKNIAKDKKDSSKFTLTFGIEGDVVAGQNIKVELGDAASPFDRVIPRNAVKKDSSGSFVYVVRSKSSPLGNRYIADKISVTVIAEDDTQCAVNGDFGDSADYIITASSKPFSAGDQVRFSQE